MNKKLSEKKLKVLGIFLNEKPKKQKPVRVRFMIEGIRVVHIIPVNAKR